MASSNNKDNDKAQKEEEEDSLNQNFIQDDDDDVDNQPFNLTDQLQDSGKGTGIKQQHVNTNNILNIPPLPYVPPTFAPQQVQQQQQPNAQVPPMIQPSSSSPSHAIKNSKPQGNRKQGTVHFQDTNQIILEDNNEDHSPRNSAVHQKIKQKKEENVLDQNIDEDDDESKNNVLHSNINDDEEVNYGKGETPIDLFLEGTYEDGRKTTLDPISVYRPKVKPKLVTLRDGEQSYLHFNEQSYYSKDNNGNNTVLRPIGNNDGFLGYYSNPVTKNNNTLKMLVCVTMYSEERVFLEQTLFHIFKNMKGFEDIGIKDFQIVVVVIQDGITKMKEEVVDFYCDLEGVNMNPHRNLKLRRYEIKRQEQFIIDYKNQRNTLDSNEGLPNTIPKRIALVYQNRIQFVKENLHSKTERPRVYSSNHSHYDINQPGMTVLSVFKHKNAKKLSSHMWFFEGFCRQFRPKYCALVDVGTLPASDGLLKFYIAMEGDPRVGGVCGFLGLEDPPDYDEQGDIVESQPMLKLNQMLKQEQDNKLPWQQKVLRKKKEEEDKQQQKVREQQNQNVVNEELEEIKKTHFYKMHRNQTVFQYILFFPIMLMTLIIGFIWKGISIVVSYIFGGLRWFAVNYLDNFASLKKAQLYEYTMAHMVDKNFESLLGFLHVLPGAWSAYRYEALEVKYSNRQNLLQKKYFKQLVNPDKLEGNIKEANMFLAEDRILCLGIYCQPDSNFMLKFIPDAKAFTDPVGTLEEFMNQRRRWINSTMFALDYVLKHYSFHVTESSHNKLHKDFLLPFNMLFARIGDFNSYFIPAFYFFVALMSSFQLMSPQISDGYQLIPLFDDGQKEKCQVGKKLDLFELECDSTAGITEGCYISCQTSDYPKFFYVSLNLVPFIYILSFLLIVFASLTFKVRKVSQEQYDKLRRTCLDENQAAEIADKEAEIKGRENGLRLLQDPLELKREKKDIQRMKEEVIKRVKLLSATQYRQNVARISEHHVKLTPAEKKFKIAYDGLTSQEYANDMFKILATIMSLISMVIMLIVTFAVMMNVFNSDFGIVKGFVHLDGWLKTYIIVMVCVNLGSFFGVMLVHLLLQPKLVWYIVISYWSYIVYQPIYNFILIIFSFCNIDDVTWGTKGLSDSKDANSYYQEKVKFLVRWFSSNILLLLLLIGGNVFSGKTPYIILFIGLYGTAYLAIKSSLAIINYVKYFIFNKLYYKFQVKKTKNNNIESQERLKWEYDRFISRMDNDRIRSQSRYEYPIYQQNPSVSGSVFNENFIFHSRFGGTAGTPNQTLQSSPVVQPANANPNHTHQTSPTVITPAHQQQQ